MIQGTDDISVKSFDYLPEPIFLLDKNGIIQYSNFFVEKLFDMNSEKFIGKKFYDFIDAHDVTRVKKEFKILLKESESSLLLSYGFQLPTGKKIPVTSTLKDLTGVQGINGILLILRDVTAEKNLERNLRDVQQELKKSVQHIQFINDNTLDFIFQVTLTGEFTYVTPASRWIAGYEPDEMIGTKWMSYVPKKELPRYLTKVKEMISGSRITDFQTFVIHKKGYLVPVEFSGSVVKRDKKIYINGIMRELSDRIDSKQQLEALTRTLEGQVEDRKKELEWVHEQFLQSEARYTALFMNLPDAAGVTDEDGRVIDINTAMARRFHKTREELIGKYWRDILPEDIYNERFKYGKKAIDTNTVQWIMDQRAGLTLQTFYVPIILSNKKKYACFVSRDITKIKEQAEEISKSEERYRLLFEHANEAIIIAQDEYLKLVNPMFLKLAGYSKDKIYSTPFVEFIHPDDRKLVFDRYSGRLSGEHPPSIYEFRIINQSGEIRWFRINSVLFRWDEKPATLNFLSDITDKINAEQELRESEERFRTVTESAQDAIIMINDEGKTVLWNKSAERIFGYTSDEFKEKPVHNLLASTVQQKGFLRLFEDFRKTGKGPFIGKTIELNALKKGKTSFPIELSLSSVQLKGRWFSIAIIRDISERKELEKHLLQSNRILEKRVEERTAELKESELRYRTLFEFAPIGIGKSDKNGNVLDANKKMIEIMGYSNIQDLKKINIKELYVNPDDRKKLLQGLQRRGSVRDFLVQLKKKDGEIYYALLDVDIMQSGKEDDMCTTVRDVTVMVDSQREIAETRDFLRNIIDSASEFMMAIDPSMQITIWNKKASALTGYRRNEVIGKQVKNCPCFENASVLVDYMKSILEGHKSTLEDIIINPKSSGKRIIKFSSSKIYGLDKEIIGSLFVGYDISDQSKIHGKLLQGSSYLITDESLKSSIDLFVDLQMSGYHGLFLSRGNPVTLKNLMPPLNVEMFIFNEAPLLDAKTIVSLDDIYNKVKCFLDTHDVSVLLFDRLDYLIVLHSFTEVLHFLYKVNSLISDYKTILLLHLNPSLLDEKDFSFFKQEFRMLPVQKVDTMQIDDALYDVLLFVHEQNKRNILVSFQKIGNHLSISKVTTQKRVHEMEIQGLIGVKLKGRMKTVFVTSKGESLLHHRAAV
jgi:PAS domain S-box-containing protein